MLLPNKFDDEARELRGRVLSELAAAGFALSDGLITVPKVRSKEEIRGLHSAQRAKVLQRNRQVVLDWEDRIIANWIADGRDVDPAKIDPQVRMVTTKEEAAVFRFATLQWSIPVSQGYGRRTRFLVTDRYNGRLIGVFALGDPVYNLSVRDADIGWTAKERNSRLYNVLDAFVMGALPPYRHLLAGKLIALMAVSDTTLDIIERKYIGRVTHIQNVNKLARPVLITTTSALGKSSVYNRLNVNGRHVFRSVGYTRGFGHFQFSDELFNALANDLKQIDLLPGSKYGEGPNWRMRVLRTALSRIGLNPDLIRHGIKREVYVAPLATNWKEFLLHGAAAPDWYEYDSEELASHFRTRWAVPRASWDSTYQACRKEDLRISPYLDVQPSDLAE